MQRARQLSSARRRYPVVEVIPVLVPTSVEAELGEENAPEVKSAGEFGVEKDVSVRGVDYVCWWGSGGEVEGYAEPGTEGVWW